MLVKEYSLLNNIRRQARGTKVIENKINNQGKIMASTEPRLGVSV